jgi:hypothetical protein
MASEDGVWTTPDGRPPANWSFWLIPEAREREAFWPLKGGVPIVPQTRLDIDVADILIRKQPGDELWAYRSPPMRLARVGGTGGITLVRNGRVLCGVTTRIS